MFFYYYTIRILATAFFNNVIIIKNVNHGNCKRLFNL